MLRNLFKGTDKNKGESEPGGKQENWFNRLKSGLAKTAHPVDVAIIRAPADGEKD